MSDGVVAASDAPRLRPKTVTVTALHPHHPGYRETRDGPGPAIAWTQGEMRVAVGWKPHAKGGSVRVERDSMGRPYVCSPREVRIYVDGLCPSGVTEAAAELTRGHGPLEDRTVDVKPIGRIGGSSRTTNVTLRGKQTR